MTSWPEGKAVAAVAVWTPLVKLPVLSPSATWTQTCIRSNIVEKESDLNQNTAVYHSETNRLKQLFASCLLLISCHSEESEILWCKLMWVSPGEGRLRSGFLSLEVLIKEVKAVVWFSELGFSSVGSHQPEPPGPHPWDQILEDPLLAGTPRPREPDREVTNQKSFYTYMR